MCYSRMGRSMGEGLRANKNERVALKLLFSGHNEREVWQVAESQAQGWEYSSTQRPVNFTQFYRLVDPLKFMSIINK